MITTTRLAAIAIVCVLVLAALAGGPAGDAPVGPPPAAPMGRPRASGGRAVPRGARSAEEVFAARYAAYFEQGISPGLPVTMCEARLQECRGLDLAACREHCRQACDLE
jgi:hypothetical protein